MNEHLNKLREITTTLPDLSAKIAFGLIEYETDGKPITGIGLYNNGVVAVQRCQLPKGTHLKEHTHTEAETMLVFMGLVKFNCPDWSEPRLVGVGDVIQFAPGVPHEATAIQETQMIAITIPAGDGYPHA